MMMISLKSNSVDCQKLREFAIEIWCTFILFFVRFVVILITQWSVWRAKHGAPTAEMIFVEEPVYLPTSTAYVVPSGGGGRYYPTYYSPAYPQQQVHARVYQVRG
jgi:hypothetical protein